MLPFSWRGQIVLPPKAGDDPERVLDRLQAALVEYRAWSVRREPGTVNFDGAMFRFVSSRNPLVSITWGRLEVARGREGLEVRCHISFSFLVFFATVAFVPFAIWLFVTAGSDIVVEPFVVSTIAWVLFVVGNIAIALARFPRFVLRWSIGEDTATQS